MTAAGVQNIEPAAYFPPPPSTSSSDAKVAGAAGSPSANTHVADKQDKPQDFQSELARQDTGSKETKSPGRTQIGSTKTGSGKSGKKHDAPTEENPSASLAVQVAGHVAEPPKQILPLMLALPKHDDGAKADEEAGEAHQKAQAQALPQLVLPNQLPAANAAPTAATPDSAKDPILPLAVALVQPEASKSQDQPATSDNRGASSDSERASQAELKLAETTPPEPVAAAIEETKDSGQSGPSALAFAARMAAAPQKADGSVPGNPSEPPAATGARLPSRIPMRYAATAQILQNAGELAKDGGATQNRDSQASSRTDMLIPRIESAREAAPSSGPSFAQQAAPSARMERIIEPPSAPPTSARDIRVQVPDNNGGSTQVRFVESGGEVRVSVRTADEGLAQNLRTHLNDLTQRLADGGMPAEFWKPASPSGSPQNNHSHPDRDGRGSGGQQSGAQDAQQDRRQERPAWLEEMEASLHGAEV